VTEEQDIKLDVEAPATPEPPAEPAAEEQSPDGAGAEEHSPDGAAAVEEDLAELVAKRDEYLELARRTRADFENYRKRMTREVSAAERHGAARLARELLPALDNLHLALEAETEPSPFADGVRLVQRELLAALGRAGIEAYVPKGERFDPQVHEAVAQQSIDGAEPGTIVEVMQHGYRHGDAVLRPARVLVAG
jgi:molecular chaperone GrpE